MGTSVLAVAVEARCPLCGSPVLSVGRRGQVLSQALRLSDLGAALSRGYSLCDDCGFLADLPDTLTLN